MQEPRKTCGFWVCLSLAVLSAGTLRADEILPGAESAAAARTASDVESDGPAYTITRFDLRYADGQLPVVDIRKLLEVDIELGRTDGGYVGPGRRVRWASVRLAYVPEFSVQTFHASALRAIRQQLGAWLARQGSPGLCLTPDPADLDAETGRDLRARGTGPLRLIVHSAVAAGETQADGGGAGTGQDGPSYTVRSFEFVWPEGQDTSSTLAKLLQLDIELGRVDDGYVVPSRRVRWSSIRLGYVPEFSVQRFSGGALRVICRQLTAGLAKQGLKNLRVVTHPQDIELATGKDLRPEGTGALRLLIQPVPEGEVPEAIEEPEKVIAARPTPPAPKPEARGTKPIGRRIVDAIKPRRPEAPTPSIPAETPKPPTPTETPKPPTPTEVPKPPTPTETPKPPTPTETPKPPTPEETEPIHIEQEGPAYTVTRFDLAYQEQRPGLPDIKDALHLELDIGRVPEGYIAPGKRVQTQKMRLDYVPEFAVHRFYASALRAINQQLVDHFNRQGLVGIYVIPDRRDIEEGTGTDLRPNKTGPLRLVIWSAAVKELRTVASGTRFADPETPRVNHPKHAAIREMSPVQPSSPGETTGTDLLRKDELDDYIYLLNRHPGRRVDAAVASAGQPGEVVLDYLVSESRPWLVYAQGSNTGTEQTSEWRERVGFIHNQVMNRDDIFSLDYVTASWDNANSVVASYDFPLLRPERLRLKVEGSWNEFTADEVGSANESFTGTTYSGRAELSALVWQRRNLFLDAFAGAEWKNIEVNNELIDLKGQSDFFLASAGLRLERVTETATTNMTFSFEANVPDVASTDKEELPALGRLETDDDWMVLQWDLFQSFYLEPLLFRETWAHPTGSRNPTLAHEIAISFKGQYALDNSRLIPQAEAVAGGLFTVRGYDESIAAGDTALIGTLEYRFHFPRVLKPDPDPARIRRLLGKPFRFAPPHVYGRPDWDLILRGFIDGGRVTINKPLESDNDEDLLSAGVGLEIQIFRNFNLRIDWGYVLEDVKEDQASENEEGDSRIHILGTLLW